MTEQEMAEWIAENVLKVLVDKTRSGNGYLINNSYVGVGRLTTFIYSPDGLFAVLQVISKDLQMVGNKDLLKAWNTFFINQDYEAFYNAVKEAWEG